ncbi:MAG: SAM-dependent methyltransferase [Pseudomonadota bacterium]
MNSLLFKKIKTKIKQSGGFLGFDEYMQHVLYEPELGYYNNGNVIFGEHGDYATAPVISKFFSQSIAKFCDHLITTTGSSTKTDSKMTSILEIGAGNGQMAREVLHYMNSSHTTLHKYLIFEQSEHLRSIQKKTILPGYKGSCAIEWLDQLPEKFTGIILANEVLDALPAKCFCIKDKKIFERGVTIKNEKFCWAETEASSNLKNVVEGLLKKIPHAIPEKYYSEINLQQDHFVRTLSKNLEEGFVILCDYGYSRNEYYNAERDMGTLICHYRQNAHENPFINIGNQDITVSVDFSYISEIAQLSDFDLVAYTTQAQFVLSAGIIESFSIPKNIKEIQEVEGIKKLVLPSDMGEHFKTMVLAKNIKYKEIINMRDYRHQL